MSIWNKVLLWLIGLASIGFLILAARTLQTHSYWLDTAQKLQKSIGDEGAKTGVREEISQLKTEIAKERIELHHLLVDRPQVWPKCTAQVKVDDAKAAATILAGDLAVGHGIAANSTLYAFEEPAAGSPGRYLGEFNVTQAAEKQITLQSAYPLSPLEIKSLRESRGLWTFYNVLPPDNHETFTQLTDEEKKAVLPAETLADYVKDGKPAGPQDPKERIDANGNYVRQLRDYTEMLNYGRRQKTILFDEIEAVKRDKALVEESLADAQRQVQFAQNAIGELKTLLAKKEKERDDVAKFDADKKLAGGVLKLLQDKLALIDEIVKRLIEENKAMAGQIAQKQWEATRMIDARIRAMAQNGGGEK
jgi:hypothetical protein